MVERRTVHGSVGISSDVSIQVGTVTTILGGTMAIHGTVDVWSGATIGTVDVSAIIGSVHVEGTTTVAVNRGTLDHVSTLGTLSRVNSLGTIALGAISGTVDVSSMQGTVKVHGSVGISSVPLSVQGTQLVHGSVGISNVLNVKGTQLVHGSVGISSVPLSVQGTQLVHGSVGVRSITSGTVGLNAASVGRIKGTAVYGTSAIILNSDVSRVTGLIKNMGGSPHIFMGFASGVTAGLGSATNGFPLGDKDAYEISAINLYTGDVYAITHTGIGPVRISVGSW